jgi:hypothetical protein
MISKKGRYYKIRFSKVYKIRKHNFQTKFQPQLSHNYPKAFEKGSVTS